MSSTSLNIIYIFFILYFIYIFIKEKNNPSGFSIQSILILIIIILIEAVLGYLIFNLNITTIFTSVILTWLIILAPNILIYNTNMFSLADDLNSIFSNVIGYLFVSNDASRILSTILNDQEKDNFELNRLVLEIKKSYAIFINQFTPSNFEYLWDNLLKPLIITKDEEKKSKLKEEFKELVNNKFLLGKCIWFFYTFIICFSISTYLMII